MGTIIFLSYFWHLLSGVWNKIIAPNMGDSQYIIGRDYFQKIRLWKLSSLNFCWSEILKRSDCVQASTYLFFLGIYTFQDVISASNPSKILWSNLLWNRNRIFILYDILNGRRYLLTFSRLKIKILLQKVFGSILPSKGWFTNFWKKL